MPTSTYVGQPVDLSEDRAESERRRKLYDTRADETYDFGKAAGTDVTDRANQVSDQALDTSKSFSDYAKADRSLFENTFVPGLKQQMTDAMGWDSPGELSRARGEASALNTMAFTEAGNMARRELEGFGIDPSAGKYAGLETAIGAKQATSGVGAMNQAANRRQLEKQALLAQANQMGLVLPGQAVNEAGVSLAGGNASENAKVAAGDFNLRARGPSGWVAAGDAAHDDIRNSLISQTVLGMQQNRDAAEQRLAQQKLDQSAGGSGMGLLGGSLLGSFMNMGGSGTIMNMLGGLGMSGGGAGPYASAGSGALFKRGGAVPAQAFTPNYRAGGSVEAVPQLAGGGMLGGIFSDDDDLASQDSTGEAIGRGVGSTIGQILGSIWGPAGSAIGGEVLGRVGPAVGAAIEGKWGEAGGDLIEGTPLDLIFAEGGNVPDEPEEFDSPEEEMAEPTPGVVPTSASPSGGEATDDVHAMLNEGEFVIPKDIVRWNGEKFFQKLIEKSYAEMQGPKTAEPEYAPMTAEAMAPPTFQTTSPQMGDGA